MKLAALVLFLAACAPAYAKTVPSCPPPPARPVVCSLPPREMCPLNTVAMQVWADACLAPGTCADACPLGEARAPVCAH